MRVSELGLDPRIVQILAGQGIEELYPPQAQAVGPALLGENLVLAIPTASGKSLVAYLAILASILRGGKALYIVPLRALATEKFEDLKAFEPLGVKVGVTMGDYDSPDPTLERFDVIIATSERADSLLRHRTQWLQKLTVVVADEIHLINDADRGPTLEVTLAKLRQVNPRAQVIALSATIRNSEELARWLEAEHVKSEWRPVPLKEGVYHDGRVHFVDGSVQDVRAHEEDVSGLVTDIMASGGQALVFVNTRRSTEALARSLAKDVKGRLNEKDRERLKNVAEALLRGQDEATSMAARLGKCIEGGVAFHNAGLTNDQRALVEKEFRKGRLRCIVATPTLCLHPETLITTLRGPVRISDIRKGDFVMTHKGRFRAVLGVSRLSYDGELLDIRAEGMVPVRMTPRHRVLRSRRRPFGRGTDRDLPEWVRAEDVRVGEEVHSPVELPPVCADGGRPELPIRESLVVDRNPVGSVFPHPSTGPAPPSIEMDDSMAELFGLYAAEDSTYHEGVVGSTTATDQGGLAQFIAELPEEAFHGVPQAHDRRRPRRRIEGSASAVARFLDTEFGRGPWGKHFPETLMSAPTNVIRGLLRGAWKGSGTINVRGPSTARFTTVSPRLAEQMARLLKGLGYMPSVKTSRSRGMGGRTRYRLTLCGAHGEDFLARVMDVDPHRIQKETRSRTPNYPLEASFRAPIRRIRRVPYKGWVYNLSVEGDESYVCSFAFSVHNSAGINLPARRVVVRDLSRFDVNYGLSLIPVLEIKQMCGRAGRPKYDPYGEAILFAKDIDGIDELFQEYFLSEPEAIESKLGSEPALRMHVLASIATGHVGTEEELFEFFNQTFYAFAGDLYAIRGKVMGVLDFLQREDFITRSDGGLRATLFGKRTSDLYVDPLSAVRMRDALEGPRDDPFFHLWAVCSTPDMPKLYLRRGDYAWVEQKIEHEDLTFPVEDYDFFLAEVKTAALLDDWVGERTEEEVTKRFSIGPGDIRRMTDQAEWLLYAMSELGRLFSKKKVRPLTRLTIRVQYGVKEELLEMVSLRGVGRVRARALFQRGYRSLRDLQKADAGELARIPAIGSGLAKRIKEQLGDRVDARDIEGQAALGDFP